MKTMCLPSYQVYELPQSHVIHTYIHIYLHTYIHTYIHTYRQPDRQTFFTIFHTKNARDSNEVNITYFISHGILHLFPLMEINRR